MKLLTPDAPIALLDPSDKFRPEKNEDDFRKYTEDNAFYDRVYRTYYTMHSNQTVDFVQERTSYWTKFNHFEMTIMEALEKLNSFIDESDPDVNVPNSVHAFQTAERIRERYPGHDWFQLTGLIHDLGKVMCLCGEPQWSTTGDTFPVGCRFSEKSVFGLDSFRENPDFTHPVYSLQLGKYDLNCGLEKVTMSWGHDEYLYRVLVHHASCSLPAEGLAIIRYHSFYPWHTAGEYTYLTDETDRKMLPWIQTFNSFDLYSNADDVPDAKELMPYYQALVDKYIPGTLKW